MVGAKLSSYQKMVDLLQGSRSHSELAQSVMVKPRELRE